MGAGPGGDAGGVSLHDELVERAVAATGGVRPVEQGEGDSVVVAFAQRLAGGRLRARAAARPPGRGVAGGLRAAGPDGAAHRRGAAARRGDYVGPALNRCARLRAVAHGGQALLSRATDELVAEAPAGGGGPAALGEHRLRDLARPEQVFQLVHPELPADFPPLRSLDALPNNLPLQLTSFVGRERELAEVGGAAGRRRAC